MNRSSSVALPADVVLRAVAIVMVVVNHASVTDARVLDLGGGLNILLLLAGFSFARFTLAHETPPELRKVIIRSAFKLWLPCLAIVLLSFALKRDWSWGEVLFISNFTTPAHIALLYSWYPQVILQLLAVLFLLSYWPGAAGALARHPRRGSALLLVLGFAVMLVVRDGSSSAEFASRTLPGIAWNFLLGWTAWFAIRGPTKLAAAGRIGLLAGTALLAWLAFDADEALRSTALVGAMAAILFVDRIRLPAWAGRIFTILSQAAFTIFLWHVFFLRGFDILDLRRSPAGHPDFDGRDVLLASTSALLGCLALWLALTSLRRAWRFCRKEEGSARRDRPERSAIDVASPPDAARSPVPAPARRIPGTSIRPGLLLSGDFVRGAWREFSQILGLSSSSWQSVAQIFASLLPVAAIDRSATFSQLAGDSLAYVQTMVALEDYLGAVPEGWEGMTVAQLEERQVEPSAI